MLFIDEPDNKFDDKAIAIYSIRKNKNKKGHEPAKRIVKREHFRRVYERNEADLEVNTEAAKAVYQALCKEYGEENVKIDTHKEESTKKDFPVYKDDNRIVSSISESDVLTHLPLIAFEYIFVNPDLKKEARKYIERNRKKIIKPKKEEE